MRLISRNGPTQLDVYCGDELPLVRYEFDGDGNISNTEDVRLPGSANIGYPQDIITPGLVDIQVNGFNGVDFNAPGLTAEALDKALTGILASGVTRVLPTIITANEDRMITLLSSMDKAVKNSRLGPFMVPGYHIEGPFLSHIDGYAGVHPTNAMVPASIELVNKLQQACSLPVMIMTLAPERSGALDLIPELRKRGIVCALGHTNANSNEIDKAIELGASLSTHLGNGLPHQLNKFENPLFSQLERDELTASFIADGIHIPQRLLQVYFRAKTLERTIITTDAVAAAGRASAPGIYTLGDAQIELQEDGVVRIPGTDYFAGSSARMDQMVRNLEDWHRFTMHEILMIARKNPARLLNHFNAIPTPNSSAEFVCWERDNDELQVSAVHIGPWMINTRIPDRNITENRK